MDIKALQYPVGEYVPQPGAGRQTIDEWISIIEAYPSKLNALVNSLSEEQLEQRYRPGGWTIRQVIHHTADSHLNSFIRFKWALTEDRPTIKPYDQSLWAECPDTKSAPVELSLELLSGLHKRWVFLLRGLSDAQLKLKFIHPEHTGELDLQWMIGMYAWHCRHHYAHIEQALKRPA
jgi:hypothetical protein